MNAGVASNSAVSVGVVPYGASPYTASVEVPRELWASGVGLSANAAPTDDNASATTTPRVKVMILRMRPPEARPTRGR